jgi:hypothetical protein
MARTLEFYFDYGSPYSYLADNQVEAVARPMPDPAPVTSTTFPLTRLMTSFPELS